MKDNIILTISAVLTVVLTMFHVTSDVQLGLDKPGLGFLFILAPVMVVFLYGALVLFGRRSGYITILVGSLFALAVCYLHLSSPRIVERAAQPGGYFFIWTLLAIAVTALFSIVLAARLLVIGSRASRDRP
jgi:hypothetical protein